MLFTVKKPCASPVPVIVEVPHAGLRFDPESLALCVAPGRSVGCDADLYVDDLFAASPDLGATLLVSLASRYVCDLNRAETELDSLTSPGGQATNAPHGVVWRRTTSGRAAIPAPLEATEIERRLELLYRPYHATLRELVTATRDRFGYAILLCAHSMPSFGRLGERRADLVPGSRGRTSACAAVIDATDTVADRFGMEVAHDAPYRGGFATRHYGRPEEGVHALQIELARRLYMDEGSLARLPLGFERTQQFCNELVAELASTRPNS